MKKAVDADTQEIIASFISEGIERLDDAEAQLERLGQADDTESLNSIFRLFHSVKGSAGFLGFENIKLLTHEAETLLELYRKEKIPVSPEGLDLVYQTIDGLRSMIALVERDNSDDEAVAQANERSLAVKEFIVTLRAGVQAPPAAAPPPAPGVAPAAAPPPQSAPAVALPGDSSARTSMPNEILLNELVTRDMAERFLAESADLIDSVEHRALGLLSAADPHETVNDMFRSIHTIKGNAGFFGDACLEAFCMDFEGSLDKARRGDVAVDDAFTSLVMSRVDGFRAVLGATRIVEAGSEPVGSAASEPYRPLGEILVNLGAVEEDDLKKALEVQEKPLGELLVDSGAALPEDVTRALDIQKRAAGSPAAVVEEIQRKEIRVDTTKLDKLFELVGELITAQAMVANSPDLADLKLDHFTKSFGRLTKISRDLQETSMMIRMIPLEGLFHKMARLVRDLSRKVQKPIDFRMTGQDTEMDKNVIEQISDPLVHILRNAIDHGLETPAQRKALGKPDSGRIELRAKYEGSEIWISVSDDGAGLNRERIVAKALQNGLVSGDPATIPDAEIWKCIFEPGFSTAEKVSDVSGRGVGMDVVKKNLERIRGRVDISTEAGRGSEFVLKIPLTMAIIDGITVRCGPSYYSIPLGDILEFFKATTSQITLAEGGRETLTLRGEVLPLLKLGDLFHLEGYLDDPTAGTLIVAQSAGKKICLLIDEVVGNQQIVVKSLSNYLGKVDGISGCSILGDGKVSFIIDTGKLIARNLE